MSELPPEKRPVVLVVDDDETIRQLVKLALGERFEVVLAPHALEALSVVATQPVDVVVCDVMMPGMTGIDAVPLLKAKAKGLLPVLLLTALDDKNSRHQGLLAGADDYLAKPLDRQELVLRVQHFVRLRRQDQLIREQLEKLTHLQALKDDLTALLVHDLKNPLTAVRSAFQLMEANITEDDQGVFSLGTRALNRVMEGVEDLLRVQMLEERQLPLALLPLDLAELARGVEKTLRAAALDGKVQVDFVTSGDTMLDGDDKLLRRALENLLINGFRHTRGEVLISVTGDAGHVRLEVADRGQGVPDFLKGELFDRFGSITLKESGGRRGHGLGLYLVRLVVRAHGGEVEVRDREGGGAVFCLTLPRHPAP